MRFGQHALMLSLYGAALFMLLLTAQVFQYTVTEETATEARHWREPGPVIFMPEELRKGTKDSIGKFFPYNTTSLIRKLPSVLTRASQGSTQLVKTSRKTTPLLGVKKCKVLPGGFKAWRQGMVTTLTPFVPVNCSKVIAGEDNEIARVNKIMSAWKNAVSDQTMLERVQNCSWLVEYFTHNLYISEEEWMFPIAFALVVYDSPQQVLRLLRLLYRPHYVYCIHYDRKSRFKEFFESIAWCFDNVIIASQAEDVVWGYYTIMQAQRNCLTDLLEYRATQEHKWRYVINLCGKELPLTTNREMVSRLTKLEGSSSIVTQSCANKKQIIQQRLTHPVRINREGTGIVVDKQKWLDLPFNLTFYHKSSSYNALSFEFANYTVFNSTAQKFYEFFKKTRNSEEHFYATLYHFPGVPGGYKRHLQHQYFEVAGSYWSKVNTFQKRRKYACRGAVVHEVCVVGAGDLSALLADRSRHLFHNKYFMELDHTVMGCMEELIVVWNKKEYQQECS